MKIIVDDADRDLLDLRAWKGINRSKGYFKARIKGEQVYLHRLIAGAKQGELVDHIDGNPLNNRRSNLRVCSYYESNANRAARRDSRAPYKGITCRAGRWVAQITKHGRHYWLGAYSNPEDAAKAYDAKAVELFGPFSRTNGFISYAQPDAR